MNLVQARTCGSQRDIASSDPEQPLVQINRSCAGLSGNGDQLDERHIGYGRASIMDRDHTK